ncbi:hypothetical protein PAPYR_6154 [Paratrimastix pyriformis]|uniref:Uncharacterized protein n=1 Tax=Paratrimastix pyriformis TaxID=342808 RepID=A0ABQ8UKG0_9EUKA|nr:hypothetical protein PAPYR_6154 [Paratrimastix pyriformis]
MKRVSFFSGKFQVLRAFPETASYELGQLDKQAPKKKKQPKFSTFSHELMYRSNYRDADRDSHGHYEHEHGHEHHEHHSHYHYEPPPAHEHHIAVVDSREFEKVQKATDRPVAPESEAIRSRRVALEEKARAWQLTLGDVDDYEDEAREEAGERPISPTTLQSIRELRAQAIAQLQASIHGGGRGIGR